MGFAGQVSDELLRSRDLYEAALDAYFRADFPRALQLFGDLRNQDSTNRAAAVLYDRVNELLNTRVPDTWDGTYSASFK